MTAAIKVTVAGPDVTVEITLEQVRAYLRDHWSDSGARPLLAGLGCGFDAGDVVRAIAGQEGRHPAEVLREIAGEAAPSAELDLDAIEARAKAATRDPAEDCARCHETTGACEADEEPTALCDSCAHHAAEELAVDASALVAEVRRIRAMLAREAAR